MVSGGLPVSQQLYFSTHNALRAGEVEDQKFDISLYEMRGERRITLSIYPFYDVQMIKRLLIKRLLLPKSTRVKDIRVIYKGADLPNWRVMNPFEHSSRKLHWEMHEPNPNASIRDMGFKLSVKMSRIIDEVKLAFKRGIAPKLTMEGTGGTYVLFNVHRQIVSVFKPCEEEAFAPCNPRGYEGKMNQQGFRAGVLSGEGASREVAACWVDSHYGSFAGVPETTMVECCHPTFCHKKGVNIDGEVMYQPFVDTTSDSVQTTKWKAGSLQEFVSAKECCGNYDPRQFCIKDVHRIGILDIRMMNLDRNDGNILVAPLQSLRLWHAVASASAPANSSEGAVVGTGGVLSQQSMMMMNRSLSHTSSNMSQIRFCHSPATAQSRAAEIPPSDMGLSLLTPDRKPTKYKLIPIDHGLILPDVMDVATIDLVWFDWPQSKVPFSETELAVILSFEPDKDAERLKRRLLIRDECLRTMRVATRLLQIGAKMHLNLNQIASLYARQDLDGPSALEKIVQEAMRQSYMALDSTSLISTNRLGYMIDLAATTPTPAAGGLARARGRQSTKDRDKDKDRDREKVVEICGRVKDNKTFGTFDTASVGAKLGKRTDTSTVITCSSSASESSSASCTSSVPRLPSISSSNPALPRTSISSASTSFPHSCSKSPSTNLSPRSFPAHDGSRGQFCLNGSSGECVAEELSHLVIRGGCESEEDEKRRERTGTYSIGSSSSISNTRGRESVRLSLDGENRLGVDEDDVPSMKCDDSTRVPRATNDRRHADQDGGIFSGSSVESEVSVLSDTAKTSLSSSCGTPCPPHLQQHPLESGTGVNSSTSGQLTPAGPSLSVLPHVDLEKPRGSAHIDAVKRRPSDKMNKHSNSATAGSELNSPWQISALSCSSSVEESESDVGLEGSGLSSMGSGGTEEDEDDGWSSVCEEFSSSDADGDDRSEHSTSSQSSGYESDKEEDGSFDGTACLKKNRSGGGSANVPPTPSGPECTGNDSLTRKDCLLTVATGSEEANPIRESLSTVANLHSPSLSPEYSAAAGVIQIESGSPLQSLSPTGSENTSTSNSPTTTPPALSHSNSNVSERTANATSRTRSGDGYGGEKCRAEVTGKDRSCDKSFAGEEIEAVNQKLGSGSTEKTHRSRILVKHRSASLVSRASSLSPSPTRSGSGSLLSSPNAAVRGAIAGVEKAGSFSYGFGCCDWARGSNGPIPVASLPSSTFFRYPSRTKSFKKSLAGDSVFGGVRSSTSSRPKSSLAASRVVGSSFPGAADSSKGEVVRSGVYSEDGDDKARSSENHAEKNGRERNSRSTENVSSTSVRATTTKKDESRRRKRSRKSKKESGGASAGSDGDRFSVRSTRLGTVRRINGTNRGTAYRHQQMLTANSTWALQDHNNRLVPVNWDDPRFERLFFEVFEERLRMSINQEHPDWRSYPYCGAAIEAHFAAKQKMRRRQQQGQYQLDSVMGSGISKVVLGAGGSRGVGGSFSAEGAATRDSGELNSRKQHSVSFPDGSSDCSRTVSHGRYDAVTQSNRGAGGDGYQSMPVAASRRSGSLCLLSSSSQLPK